MADKISVAIVDDHAPFREGLMALLEKYTDIKIAFEACEGQEAIDKLKSHSPDVILMDLEMPGLGGEETFEIIKQKHPKTRVIILTGYFNDSFVVRFIKKQIPSILSKATATKKIAEAIRLVHQNGFYYDETVSAIMARTIADTGGHSPGSLKPAAELNIQEIQVVKLMCQGYTTSQIATKLHRSDRTIDSNRNSIWHKTEIKSKQIPDLIVYALKHNIISIL